MAQLARELQFASPQAARRLLARVETLASELLKTDGPSATMPAEWVVFRITGLLPDFRESGSGDALVREAVLADLGALSQRLSHRAHLSERDCPSDSWLSPDDLGRRWTCSRKTIERAQRRGLVSRRVHSDDDRERIVFSIAVVSEYERQHAGELSRERARARTGSTTGARMSGDERDEIIRRARAYQSRFGLSLDRCASRLAHRFGRTRQGVRRVLLGAEPPLETRHADAQSLDAGPKSGEHRAKRLARLVFLSALNLAEHAPSTAPRALRADQIAMLRPPEPLVLGALLALGARARELSPKAERELAEAYNSLVQNARVQISGLSRSTPKAASLDLIETTLRIAGRIKGRLINDELALVVRTIESLTAAPALSMGARAFHTMARAGIGALIESFSQYDPSRGGRLASPATIAISRAVTAALREIRDKAASEVRPKAIARSASVDIDSPVWDGIVVPWQRALEPPAEVIQRIDALPDSLRALMCERLGLPPSARGPRTLADIAQEQLRPLVRVAADERRARELLGWSAWITA